MEKSTLRLSPLFSALILLMLFTLISCSLFPKSNTPSKDKGPITNESEIEGGNITDGMLISSSQNELPFVIVRLHERNDNAGRISIKATQERAAKNIDNCYLIDLDSLGACADIHPQNKEDVSALIYGGYYKAQYN